MSGVSNNAPQTLQVNRPSGNFDLNTAFEKSAALQNKYTEQADNAGKVGFFGKVGDFFVPSRVKTREDKVQSLHDVNQLIAQIRESMAKAFEQMNRQGA